MSGDSVGIEDRNPLVDAASIFSDVLSQDPIPVLHLHGPFPCDVLSCQIQQLQH